MQLPRSAVLVREVRRRAGLSQRELARRAGTSGPTIAAYEAGAKEPRLSTLEGLAIAAGQRVVTEVDVGDDDRKRRRRRLRSLALAAATAEVVRSDWPRALTLAEENLRKMAGVVGDNRGARWIEEWRSLIDAGRAEVCAALLDPVAERDDLRQMQPFAGLLTDQERRLVLASADALAGS